MWYNSVLLFMLPKIVHWSLSVILLFAYLHVISPTASADTILEIPRSDDRLFCANSLISTSIVPDIGGSGADKPNHSLNADILFSIINAYRASIGLSSFQKDKVICDIAKQRGPELDIEVETGSIHAGFYNKNLSFWATENMKYGGNEQEMFDWWMNSYIHRKAIEGDYAYSCGECYGESCVQIFTNYQEK